MNVTTKWIGLLCAVVLMTVCCSAQIAQARELSLGVTWQGQSGMAKRVLDGMEAALSEQAPEIAVEVRGELPDREALAAAVAEFEQTKDGMVVLRSNGAQFLQDRDLPIPTFIGGCNNPMALGVAESLEEPQENLSGVTYYIPAKVKLTTFKRVYPPLERILLLVEEGHPGSPIDAGETEAAAPEMGLAAEVTSCSTLDDALEAIGGAPEDGSIVIGSQALLMDSAGELVAAAGERPVFAYSEAPVEAGALAGVVADDSRLGNILGTMVAEVLAEGADIGDIPIQTDPEPTLYLNGPAAERLQLDIPFEILELATIVE